MAFKLHSFRKAKEGQALNSSIKYLDIQREKRVVTAESNEREDQDSRKSSDRSDFFATSECKQGPLFMRTDNSVILTSPTFGSRMQIKNVKVKFGTSKATLRDLKHVET